MRGFLKTTGFVIGQKDIGEKDKILTLFSKDLGKIKVFAKGIRSIRSRRTGNLQTGNIVKATLSKTNDRYYLGETELVEDQIEIKKSLVLNGGLLSACELVDRLLPESEENRKIYQLFSETIKNLSKRKRVEIIVIFEVKLLQALGYGTPRDVFGLIEKKDWSKIHKVVFKHLEAVSEKKLNGMRFFLKND
jgi:DNA repair protein RecO (recombination protein O)